MKRSRPDRMLTRIRSSLADSSLRTKGLLVVLIPLAPLLLTSLFITVAIKFEHEAAAAVDRSRQVESELHTLSTLIAEAEAGARAFVLTGEAGWLEAQGTAHRQYRPLLDRLAKLIVDLEQQKRLSRVSGLVKRRLEALDHVVSDAREQGRYPALESRSRFEQGRQLMATLRADSTAMLNRQSELLAVRVTRTDRMRRFLLMAAWLGVAFGIAGGGLAVMLFTTSISARVRALETSAKHLARGEPLPDLPTGRDEVGLLGRELQQTASLLVERDQALRRAHAALDRFFTLSIDLFCVASFDGVFKRLNPAWQETFGWTDKELCARPFLDFVHPDDVESTSREAGTLAQGAPVVQFQNRYRCQNGSYRWLEWMAVPVPEERHIYAIARDITDRKQAEAQSLALNAALRQRGAELATLNGELQSFSYSVSHDLRAPLRSVDGFSQMLLEDYGDKLDEEGKDCLQRVRAAASRMSALIDALLALSRVSRAEVQAECVHLSATADAIAIDMRRAEPAREVEFLIQPGITAKGDSRLLRAVLENLLGNAWKFTRRNAAACIEFGCGEQAGEKVYFVRDDGAGFDMTYAGKLFGAFQRLHDDKQFTGTGVGLATVQRIIHRHGGRIWAVAAVDRGATFYFTLANLVIDHSPAMGGQAELAGTAEDRRSMC